MKKMAKIGMIATITSINVDELHEKE